MPHIDDMNVFDALSHLSRPALSRTRHGLAPTKVKGYTHRCAIEIALLFDRTNRNTVRRLRKLGATLTVLDDNSFDILCDYMGYYLYDSHGLANFLDNASEIVLFDTYHVRADRFKANREFRACVDWDKTGNVDLRSIGTPWRIKFSMCASQIWLWMLSLSPFENPRSISNLRSEWALNRICDAFALYKNRNPSKKTISVDELRALFVESDSNLKLQLLSAFRKAARWPSFAL